MTKTRTITLTDRPPVRIQDAHWPQTALGSYYEYDNQYEFQANRTWKCWIRVRAHADGRALVYGRYDYDTAFQGERGATAQAGELLPAPATTEQIVAAIHKVSDTMISIVGDEYSSHIGEAERACIADLPAEDLDRDATDAAAQPNLARCARDLARALIEAVMHPHSGTVDAVVRSITDASESLADATPCPLADLTAALIYLAQAHAAHPGEDDDAVFVSAVDAYAILLKNAPQQPA